MSDPTCEIVLQIEDATGRFACKGFRGVPAGQRSWIALVSDGSDRGRNHVSDLAREIETALRASSPEVDCADVDCPAAPEDMKPEEYPGRRKVLVLVGGDQPFTDKPWYARWGSDRQQSCLMLVLPPGQYAAHFDAALPDEHLLHRVNAATWKNSIGEALPAILARAEITAGTSRVFISYRQIETLPLGLQLFDRLTEEGFDVFLDRFSIPPGFDFQRRLTQELEDKSMVVLLESKSLKTSKWTQHELDFAKRHRLGVIALRMPCVKDVLAGVSFDAREDLKKTDFVAPPVQVVDPRTREKHDQWPELKDEPLDRVVSRIKTTHAQALFRRRHRLRIDVVAGLKAAGIDTEHDAVGPLYVGKSRHVVWLTTRSPEVDDFKSLHGARKAVVPPDRDRRGIIVGPMAALEPDRQEKLEWLHDVTCCQSFDEGNLPAFVQQFTGTP